jgi:Tfp pilus assembly protein PilF
MARRSPDPASDLGIAARYAQRAVAFAPEQSSSHRARAAVLELQGDLEAALEAYRRAIALRPQEVPAVAGEGHVLLLLGRPHEAIRSLRAALATEPLSISAGNWTTWLGVAMLHAGEADNGVAALRRAMTIRSYLSGRDKALLLCAALAQNGELAEARSILGRLRAGDADLSLARVRAEAASANPRYLAQRERLVQGLALAGLE